MTHPIPDQHVNLFRTLLSLGPNDDLPEDIVDLYGYVRRATTRLGVGISPSEFILIAVLAGRAPQQEPTSFMDDDTVKTDDLVLVKFRNTWRWARFIRADQQEKKIYATIEDDGGSVRKFQPTSVRWPTKEELKSIGIV